jgi:hypothetical protein
MMLKSQRLAASSMTSTCFENDDIFQIRGFEKSIAHEESRGWQTNISCTNGGIFVETVLLNGRVDGLLPVGHREAA